MLQRWDIGPDSNVVQTFGNDNLFKVHEFMQTEKISTYLFAFVAGPFDCLLPSEDVTREEPFIKMRIYCRKSLSKYADRISERWFRVTKAAILYY